MHTVLVALEDSVLREQVQSALRAFRGIRAVAVPRERLHEVLREKRGAAQALIVDHQPVCDGEDFFLAEIRSLDRDIRILVVAERPDRLNFNKAKVDLDILSFIPLPLDPFDLLRRLHRLVEKIPARA